MGIFVHIFLERIIFCDYATKGRFLENIDLEARVFSKIMIRTSVWENEWHIKGLPVEV